MEYGRNRNVICYTKKCVSRTSITLSRNPSLFRVNVKGWEPPERWHFGTLRTETRFLSPNVNYVMWYHSYLEFELILFPRLEHNTTVRNHIIEVSEAQDVPISNRKRGHWRHVAGTAYNQVRFIPQTSQRNYHFDSSRDDYDCVSNEGI